MELSKLNPVCVSGEANAWPYEHKHLAPPYPHELVHWAARRLRDGAHFEALVAPRYPLSASPIKHAKIDEQSLRSGLTFDAFSQAWRGFYDENDVICSWGHYGTGLLRREGGTLPPKIVDMRKVAGDFLRKRPGSAEDLVKHLDLHWEPCGTGRCGERLGMLIAITSFLLTATADKASE